MLMFLKLLILCSLKLKDVFADDIDSDYFFGSSYEALRARDVFDCKNPVNVMLCKYKCKNHAAVCFEGKCYCVYEPEPDLPKKSAIITNVNYPEEDIILKYSTGRRHHIAHFCPNLDEARKCIRKCMKEGKPAFCGKDHICYCGHRYSQHQKKDELDPEKVNAGFYDLYMKYFGPETTIMENKKSKKPEENSKNDSPKKKPHESNENQSGSDERKAKKDKSEEKQADDNNNKDNGDNTDNDDKENEENNNENGNEKSNEPNNDEDTQSDNGDETVVTDNPDGADAPPPEEENNQSNPENNEEE